MASATAGRELLYYKGTGIDNKHVVQIEDGFFALWKPYYAALSNDALLLYQKQDATTENICYHISNKSFMKLLPV